MSCKVEGEKCISESSNPFQSKDLLFGSLELLGDFKLTSSPPSRPASKSCKCGIRDSCYNDKLSIQTSSRCDFEKAKCMCGELEACTGPKPWCVQQACTCSNHESRYIQGDGSQKGSCLGGNEKCMPDGSCQGILNHTPNLLVVKCILF